jgi:hypothetical protein
MVAKPPEENVSSYEKLVPWLSPPLSVTVVGLPSASSIVEVVDQLLVEPVVKLPQM